MLFCLPPDFFRAGRAFAVARGCGGTIPPPFPYIASPGQSRYKKDHRAAGPSGLLPATPTPCSAMTDEIVCRIDALSHDGRGLHRPEDGGPVIFVAGSLPGQTVRARIIRRQKRFWEAQRTAVLEDVALAADICPHGEDCGGCPWQRLPYAAQLRWKGQLVRDALERIGGLGRDAALPLRPALGSPEQRSFRNKMEFAFGPADGSLCLGLRRRGGLQVLPVPGCALLPGEGLELVTACAGLAARSGLPAYVPPRSAAEEGRLRPRADRGRGRRPRRERPGAEDCGFWRFLVVRYGWPDPDPAQVAASDAPGRRWWLTCVTSPGTAEQRRTVARMGRELLDAFPCVQAFVHEERATPDALVAGERRVLCLDRRGEALPDDEAPLYLPLGGSRHGRVRQYANLLLTMLVCGVWHGAGLTFLLWGALHGLLLLVNHAFRHLLRGSLAERVLALPPLRALCVLVTFLCLTIAWVLFRAGDTGTALHVWQSMFLWSDGHPLPLQQGLEALLPGGLLEPRLLLPLLAVCAVIVWALPCSQHVMLGRADGSRPWLHWQPNLLWAVALALPALASLLLMQGHAFLSFRF